MPMSATQVSLYLGFRVSMSATQVSLYLGFRVSMSATQVSPVIPALVVLVSFSCCSFGCQLKVASLCQVSPVVPALGVSEGATLHHELGHHVLFGISAGLLAHSRWWPHTSTACMPGHALDREPQALTELV